MWRTTPRSQGGCFNDWLQLTAFVRANIEAALFYFTRLSAWLLPPQSYSTKQKQLINCLIPLCAIGECKYDFQAWGECDLATGKKNRTGVLKRALMDATCAATVTATKPCGKIKTKLQGKQIRNKSGLDKTHWNPGDERKRQCRLRMCRIYCVVFNFRNKMLLYFNIQSCSKNSSPLLTLIFCVKKVRQIHLISVTSDNN